MSSSSSLPKPLVRVARQAKIVGGSEADLGEFPHQVALNYNDEFICGGSILSTLLILTAAHCVKYKRPNRLKVIAGLHDQSLYSTGDEQTRTARYIYMHENYVWETDINDIAIIVLTAPLQYTSHVKNISLPRENEDFQGYAMVSGWGRTEEKGKTSEKLRKAKLPIASLETCRRRYQKMRYKITDNMLCAGESGRDSCQGDSGSALICQRKEEKVQCGIVSFGHGCGRVGFPGIYTRVSNYIDWIENTKEKIIARGKCHTDKFFCSSGPGCIERTFLCDLESDCSDGEDERGCIYMTSCRRGQFRCNNGRCIKKEWTCDDMDDCGDRSDEDKCPSESKLCVGGQHQCGIGGRCIPEEWKCDGEQDCDDNSDEKNCSDSENEIIPTTASTTTTTQSPCKAEEFYCSRDFRCIPLRWRCDRDRDCRSGMDELNCDIDDPHQVSSPNTTKPVSMITTSTTTTRRPLITRTRSTTTTTTAKPTSVVPVTTIAAVSTTPQSNLIDSSSLLASNSSSTTNSSCTRAQFHCGDGQCISNVFQCDDDLDCENGRDEEDCHLLEATCSPYFWRCGNGQCIYHRFLCDNDLDCLDGTDELDCELNVDSVESHAAAGNDNGTNNDNYVESVNSNQLRRRNRNRRKGKSRIRT